jgi:hypothetical protein
MAAAMALIESSAIMLAVVLANHARQQAASATAGAGGASAGDVNAPLGRILHEALANGAKLLLLGAMLTGESGEAAMEPFSVDLFKGMLAFFLLDMSLLAVRKIGKLRGQSAWLMVYAITGLLVHAGIALLLGRALDMSPGNVTLLRVLAASTFYIAVPAVIRHATPEANPSLYFGLSLGMTFQFNALIRIPLYVYVAKL